MAVSASWTWTCKSVRIVCLILLIITIQVHCETVQDELLFAPGGQLNMKMGQAKPQRFLLYDVNPGEGFNLRRDVYMRIANLVKRLLEKDNWVLVLPPWGRLYHWKSRNMQQIRIPWSTFFDVESLNHHVPVIEFEDYIKINGGAAIDEHVYLQSYKEGWTDGKWEERMHERECNDQPTYQKNGEGKYRGWYWGYSEAYARNFRCLSIQGVAGTLVPYLTKNITARSVMIDRAETALHDTFGRSRYWEARRSLRFAKHLRDIGDEFRKTYLDSTDAKDKTPVLEDWREMKPTPGSAVGGPYIAVHLRRQDYARSNRKEVASLPKAATHIKEKLKELKLKKVFIATDAPVSEIDQLKVHLKGFEVYNYIPPRTVHDKFMDGGVAIIDQWICAHARYFIGTGQSTFSFRIYEERQLLGFDTKMTYNRFCGDGEPKDCEPPSVWPVVY
ncbi:GDP-fucose protein O-fucosyltransferase 2-like isoform X2 [Lytechinus pictus]|uniref:GDP-fucose protein O-fucosyltransferase 2-like isoform X2 n=1 Tax=Lytechinus pictus TaxID=7653 RepID=UPI0030B9CE98